VRGAEVSGKDPDLAVFDPPGRPAVLAGHPHAFAAFLQKARFIDDQDALGVGQLLFDIAQQIVAYGIGRPLRAPQQVLHAVGGSVPEGLGQLPAVFPLNGA
jgi:hypothetical protein